jgi:hypothetical protein
VTDYTLCIRKLSVKGSLTISYVNSITIIPIWFRIPNVCEIFYRLIKNLKLKE